MRLNFRTLATFTALLCFALALVWGLRPDLLLWLWSVEYSNATGMVSRRNAALFLGIGIMFYRARHAPPSDTRRALTTGFVAGCLVLALLGFGEWINGNAGPGILLAVATETVLGLAFIQAHRSSVPHTQASS
ncbi:hypothetical protein [Pseudomonas extremorientalis]|uniref:DUF4345 domain-containing protein n=1 Tax=Pseudomonas extremorientalis TaxID=169669 RepID=A0A1H0IDM0_9PSED|nr:hypothetical protein [Pseudomonas extremorientalis]KAB0519907.1 hypothetical protein F7R08_09130 [Pseudomonas extremorientalis]OIN07474.1 hypothetical protein BFN10_16735 [Pseudomonas extremorientalis]WLG59393.1 hypothetical protein PSH77_12940 [Pseudomonas extremorientalis]SDO29171.1 hypothetical protein SAMN04490184_0185 [Pseudomonas extremorientalis]